MNEYITALKDAIKKLHGCDAKHVDSSRLTETFRGQVVWDGQVETFDLIGHPKAKRCYAWSHQEGKKESQRRYVAVLELPPVKSPLDAVRASIVGYSRKSSKSH